MRRGEVGLEVWRGDKVGVEDASEEVCGATSAVEAEDLGVPGSGVRAGMGEGTGPSGAGA